jgi:hypothetical protein
MQPARYWRHPAQAGIAEGDLIQLLTFCETVTPVAPIASDGTKLSFRSGGQDDDGGVPAMSDAARPRRRGDRVRRREFITLLGGAAAAWPSKAQVQQMAMPVIGFLSSRSSEDSAYLVGAFRNGLAEHGFIEGRSVTIEYRWASGRYDRLPAMAAELADRPVAILVATGAHRSCSKGCYVQHILSE